MNERTRSYLAGRFRDYYRRRSPQRDPDAVAPLLPPDVEQREWAYIPFASGDRSPMVRHQAIHAPDGLGDLLVRHRPRHVYHSTATYDDPGLDQMQRKGWRGADLVFDLDADHLDGVDPESASYRGMLRACHAETADLIDILETDFGFEDFTIVFSGNRGYHVHVRDRGVRTLGQAERREIVEYIRGTSLSVDALVTTEVVTGATGTGKQRRLDIDAGWGQRVHERLLSFGESIRASTDDKAIEKLASFEGMGTSRAETVARIFDARWGDIRAGHIDLHPDFVRFLRIFIDHEVATSGPAIDEPVTTDIHRLIRLPGSLHGKTGFVVQPIQREGFDGFDPLVDAIAPDFRTADIAVDVAVADTVELGGSRHALEPGPQVVPEYLGIFLMARGLAEKIREPIDG